MKDFNSGPDSVKHYLNRMNDTVNSNYQKENDREEVKKIIITNVTWKVLSKFLLIKISKQIKK